MLAYTTPPAFAVSKGTYNDEIRLARSGYTATLRPLPLWDSLAIRSFPGVCHHADQQALYHKSSRSAWYAPLA